MLLVSSFLWPKKKWISHLLTILVIARNYLPLLDLEGRRKVNTVLANQFFIGTQNYIVSILTLLLNFWYESRVL